MRLLVPFVAVLLWFVIIEPAEARPLCRLANGARAVARRAAHPFGGRALPGRGAGGCANGTCSP